MQYAKELVQSESACVIITGYQDEESLGRQLLQLLEQQEDSKITLDKTTLPVRCRIEQVGLSAHGDKSEIMGLLERIAARHVFLVHGNEETIRDFGKELAMEDYRRHIYLLECGQAYSIEIRKKRQQLESALQYTMQKFQTFSAEEAKFLWEFCCEKYQGSVDKTLFQKGAETFQLKTGWTVSINPAMNHSVAGSMFYAAFVGRLQKVSYYVERKQYAVTVSDAEDKDRETAEIFYQQTGWRLYVNGVCFKDLEAGQVSIVQNYAAQEKDNMEFVPQNTTVQPLEQNLAFSCIEQSFVDLPDSIEKKSIKQDNKGKYLEFSFISPAVGFRYQKQLQSIADQIGWRIRIADKINQNTLFQVIRALCAEFGIVPAKNPSYIPDRKVVVVKTAGEEDGKSRIHLQKISCKKQDAYVNFRRFNIFNYKVLVHCFLNPRIQST